MIYHFFIFTLSFPKSARDVLLGIEANIISGKPFMVFKNVEVQELQVNHNYYWRSMVYTFLLPSKSFANVFTVGSTLQSAGKGLRKYSL